MPKVFVGLNTIGISIEESVPNTMMRIKSVQIDLCNQSSWYLFSSWLFGEYLSGLVVDNSYHKSITRESEIGLKLIFALRSTWLESKTLLIAGGRAFRVRNCHDNVDDACLNDYSRSSHRMATVEFVAHANSSILFAAWHPLLPSTSWSTREGIAYPLQEVTISTKS